METPQHNESDQGNAHGELPTLQDEIRGMKWSILVLFAMGAGYVGYNVTLDAYRLPADNHPPVKKAPKDAEPKHEHQHVLERFEG